MLVASPGSGERLPSSSQLLALRRAPLWPRLWPAGWRHLARRPVCWWWLHLLRWRCGGGGGPGVARSVGLQARGAGGSALLLRVRRPGAKKFKLNAERNSSRAPPGDGHDCPQRAWRRLALPDPVVNSCIFVPSVGASHPLYRAERLGWGR